MGKFIVFYCVLLVSFVSYKAVLAAQTFEVEPGILEMTTSNLYGFEVRDIFEKKDKKGQVHLYFCLKEVKGKGARCFYGLKSDFKGIKKGSKLNGIQYALVDRKGNKNKNIPIRNASFFYQAIIIRPQS